MKRKRNIQKNKAKVTWLSRDLLHFWIPAGSHMITRDVSGGELGELVGSQSYVSSGLTGWAVTIWPRNASTLANT